MEEAPQMGHAGLPIGRRCGRGVAPSHSRTSAATLECLVHSAFLVFLCAFLAAQPYIRERGGLLFWLFTVGATVYAGLTVKPVVIRAVLGFTLVGVTYVALSYLDVLPDAWTTVYDPTLIPRQAFYVALLYPFTLAAYSLWSHAVMTGRLGRTLLWVFVGAGLVGPLVAFYAREEPSLLRAYASVTTGGFGNARLLFFLAWSYYLLVRVRNVEMARVLTLFIVAALFMVFFGFVVDPQLQNMLGLAAFVVLSFSAAPRRRAKALAIGGVAVYLALIPFASVIYQWDHNAGYRLILTQDALRGLVQSHFLGIGYGKEVVTADYDEYGVKQTAPGSSYDLALRGVHNSFAQQLLRLGALGGAYVVWLFFVTSLPPRDGPKRVRRHMAVVYVVLLLAIMSNVALESPTYIVGVAFALGYLLATKDRLRSADCVAIA